MSASVSMLALHLGPHALQLPCADSNHVHDSAHEFDSAHVYDIVHVYDNVHVYDSVNVCVAQRHVSLYYILEIACEVVWLIAVGLTTQIVPFDGAAQNKCIISAIASKASVHSTS